MRMDMGMIWYPRGKMGGMQVQRMRRLLTWCVLMMATFCRFQSQWWLFTLPFESIRNLAGHVPYLCVCRVGTGRRTFLTEDTILSMSVFCEYLTNWLKLLPAQLSIIMWTPINSLALIQPLHEFDRLCFFSILRSKTAVFINRLNDGPQLSQSVWLIYIILLVST